MTLPKDRKLKTQDMESIRRAVDESDIRSIHPDKLEEFAAHLVNKLKDEREDQRD